MSPAEAGLVLPAVPVLMPILSPLSGALADRIGNRLPTTAGAAIAAATLFALSRVDLDTSLDHLAGLLILLGLGTGLFTSPIGSAIFGSVPREERGVASGVMSTARGLGMVLGFCLGGTVFTAALNHIDLGVTPTAVSAATDATLLVAAGVAALSTATLCIMNNRVNAAFAAILRSAKVGGRSRAHGVLVAASDARRDSGRGRRRSAAVRGAGGAVARSRWSEPALEFTPVVSISASRWPSAVAYSSTGARSRFRPWVKSSLSSRSSRALTGACMVRLD